MSLPPTGSGCYLPYLANGPLTSTELTAICLGREFFAHKLLGDARPLPLSSDCAMLAESHKSIGDAPGRVSSPSGPSSILMGLHYTPLGDFPKKKKGGRQKEAVHITQEGATACRNQQELVIFTGICQPGPHSQFAIVEPVTSDSFMMHDRAPEHLVYATKLFELLVRDVKQAREPGSGNRYQEQTGPHFFDRDVHLEVDITVFRMVMTLAACYGLTGFRIFPSIYRPDLSTVRYRWELKVRETMGGTGAPMRDGSRHLLPSVGEAPSYDLLAFCAGAGCYKRLVGAEKESCARCKHAFYCSGDCQKKDWELLHKGECSKFAAFFKAQKVSFLNSNRD